jgi:hypothetical protein
MQDARAYPLAVYNPIPTDHTPLSVGYLQGLLPPETVSKCHLLDLLNLVTTVTAATARCMPCIKA